MKGSSLTNSAINGFVWFTGGTIITRLTNFAGHIFLAWLILPEEFGLIGLTYSIQAFAALLHEAGIRDILVSRQQEFKDLANSTFWFSLCIGLLSSFCLILSAPFFAAIYKAPELKSLILIISISMPLQSIQAIPAAKLAIDLKFRTLASVEMLAQSSQMVLTVIFAAIGCGVYSFMVAPLMVLFPKCVWLFYVTKPPIIKRIEAFRWKGFFSQSISLFFVGFCNRSVQYGDYLILGFFYPKEIIGIYYFAFNISVQTISLLSNNITQALFPLFSKIKEDPRRQKAAFLRTIRLVASVGVPAGFLLAMSSEPIVRIFFQERWLSAIPLLQFLSVGNGFRTIGPICGSYLRAQSRFSALALLTALNCIVFLIFAVAGAQYNVKVFSLAVSISFVLMGFLGLMLSLDSFKETLRQFFSAINYPVLLSLAGSALCIWLYLKLHCEAKMCDVFQIILNFLIFAVLTFFLILRHEPSIKFYILKKLNLTN